MLKSCKTFALAALFASIFSAAVVNAQIITGSFVGQVTDQSGAIVSDVQITVTNTGTGDSVQAIANNSGTYSVPDLHAGIYDLTARKAGFRTFHVEHVQLLAQQVVRVDMQLQIGSVQQQVTVTGEAPLVNTESPQIGGTISSRQMMDLPLAQQSIDGLLNLVPGAQVAGSNPQTGGATHWGATNFTINGIQANDMGNGAGAYSYGLGLVSLPALDSMQEFRVDAYNTNAEYRDVGTVTMVTKAGTNRFHGEAYEYNQNTDLNANTLLNNAQNLPRSPALRNQFGANLGGPILRNKLFFFFDYSGMRNRNYSQVQLDLPTMAMRSGDFSALCSTFAASGTCAKGTQLYNPYTGQPFANNQIPSSMIAPQATALMKYLPAPTSNFAGAGLPGAVFDYYGLVSTAQDVNALDLRMDYQISNKDLLYGVYTRDVGSPWQWALGGPPTYGNASDYGYKTFAYSLVETHTFNPHTLNDFRLAWFDHAGIRSGQNLDVNPQSFFPQLTTSPNRGLPSMTMTGYPTMFNDVGKGYYGQGIDEELTDNITYIVGRHTIKAGVNISTYKTYGPNPNAPLGTFSFTGQWTGNKGWPGQPQSQGNAFADFLLGTANISTTGSAGVFESVYWDWDTEYYVQDTWQASPRLTLSYGLRYSYQTPWHWQDGYSTYWDPKTNQLALPQNSATPTLPPIGASAAQFAAYPFTTTQALGLPADYMVSDKNNWAPRFGFAYRPFGDNRTVLRGGYGIYYNFNPAFAGSRDDVLNPPWLGGLGGYSSQTYNTQLTGNPKSTYLPDITFANPFPASLQKLAGVAASPNLYSMQRDFQNAMVQQWNLTLEHQFTTNWAARATYAGSKTDHLQWFFGDFNVPATQTPNKTIQQQRPYQPWATIYSTRSGGFQKLNQLQLELTRRFANGFSLQAEYQWTRSLDDVDYSGGPQNPNFPALDYGNSTGIRTNVLVFNYVWALPLGRGKQWLGNANRFENAVVGGWQVSGITTYETGLPFSVTFQVPSSYVGWWGGRANQVGSNLYQGQQSGSHDVVSGVQWFNPAAFAPPQPWTWGNASRNVVWGPGYSNWDISLMKSFSLWERLHLDFRGDFLDAFNHFNLGNPSGNGTVVADTRDGGLPITATGKIYGGTGNRIVQVGARIVF